ncbi:DUF342 domain-containing protein [Agaribacterium sp. ZY112]|uniref:DUF342 domain-containing protein n=1 Tax=Agaribacterium sp. ZY112 TaxID=3233574 RepID=UPI0035265D97
MSDKSAPETAANFEAEIDSQTTTRRDPPARPQFSPFSLEFDDDKGELWGVAHERPTMEQCAEEGSPFRFSDVEKAVNGVTMPKVQMEIQRLAYDKLFYPRNSVDAFVRKVKKDFPGRYLLGQRKDATIKITVSNDRLSARAQTTQAWGGSPLSNEEINQAKNKAKITEECLIESAFEKLRNSSIALDIVVAEAIPAIDGEPASLKVLVDSKKDVERDVDSLEAIDLHEVYDYTMVEEGDELVRKIPPTEGTPGVNVLGKIIKPKKGRDLKLPKKSDGVDFHPDDKNVLIAAIKGHPVVSTGQAKVDPVLTIKSVDLSSGNIDYNGTVIITGNVRSGFEVKAEGDIFVKGFVNRSQLIAGGSIFISGGVQGGGDDDDIDPKISATGNIEAKFINQATVNCIGELLVKEYLLNCETQALKRIAIGEQSGRGAIIGGHTKCSGSLFAKKVGSDAYVQTVIELGTSSAAQKELEKTILKRTRRETEQNQLESILLKIRHTDSPTAIGQVTLDKARKIEATLNSIKEIISNYDRHIESLQAVVSDADELYIDVRNTLFPGTSLQINDVSKEVDKEYKNTRVERENQMLVFNPIPNAKAK